MQMITNCRADSKTGSGAQMLRVQLTCDFFRVCCFAARGRPLAVLAALSSVMSDLMGTLDVLVLSVCEGPGLVHVGSSCSSEEPIKLMTSALRLRTLMFYSFILDF
jgi:hypothetical protein